MYLTALMGLYVSHSETTSNDYIITHYTLETMVKSTKLPKVKLDFVHRSFYFLDALIFNSLLLSLRNINSRVLFRKALDDYHM